jgi:exportin-2 (importin alpha re-exporter)
MQCQPLLVLWCSSCHSRGYPCFVPTSLHIYAPQVWLPTLPSISGSHEEKLVAVATARMLSGTSQLAAPQAAELAGQLLAALVTSLEGGAAAGAEGGAEEAGEEEDYAAGGYSAAYAKLHNARK